MLLRPVLMPILRNPLQGIADGVRNMLAELLGSSQFFAPLTHSLVLARGTGSPTFTRASTKTVENNDGYLVTLLAGEIGFPGARRVRNLITNPTENFNSGWTKIGGLTASGKTISFSASTDQLNGGVALPSPTGQYLLSFIISASAACETYLEIVDGVDGNPSFGSNVSITTVPTRVTIPCNLSVGTMSPVAPLFWVNRGSNASVAGKTITIDELQFEDITGRTDQTTPSEYVSVGVESSPAYHGSMVDGVKCFPTDLAGNALTTMRGYSAEGARTNLCLQSNAFTTTWANSGTPAATQNVVGPDGATSAWTLTDNNAASTEGVNQTIALTAATYTYSVFVKKTTGAQSSYPVVTADNGVSRIAACTIDTTN